MGEASGDRAPTSEQRPSADHAMIARSGAQLSAAMRGQRATRYARLLGNEVRAAAGHGRPPCAASAHGVARAVARIRITPPSEAAENKIWAGRRSIQFINNHAMTIHRVFLGVTFLATRAWLRPVSRGNRHFTVGGGRLRQSGPRSEGRLLRQPALEGLTRSARMDSPRQVDRNKFRRSGGGVHRRAPATAA
ncbi:hypothetical protein F511_12635 [Dorcoceras hygrometricum]|uniref:Uncharacterized protein n=1 Tax=Dorcoceras hygrometricum TaxID=472368 RepID=A0A2Z7CX53_9LAMI|nr:hypothetical protein F511_12635 [Dorcoceras hygrometricum]